MTTRAKIVLGLVGGVALGVGIGLLLAPEKGADLRKKLVVLRADGPISCRTSLPMPAAKWKV